ncbi:MAG: DUF115 domain-containing protein, partial [Actinomycetia bacterium]|nr:DUF115 domain-containing protein [Actinomycetes bacterium]
KNIPMLKKLQRRFPIFAVDTAVKVLEFHDIIPDLIMTVDAQLVNGRYLLGDSHSVPLVAEPVAFPLFRNYKGNVLFVSSFIPLSDEIETVAGERGKVAFGGSVSTNLFDLMVKMGLKNIFFLGQDLAFSGSLAHPKGSFYEEKYAFEKRDKFSTLEMMNRKQLKYLQLVRVPGNNGVDVDTTDKMLVFRNWFEGKIAEYRTEGIRVFNVSEGARINGALQAELSEIDKYSNLDNSETLPLPEHSTYRDMLNMKITRSIRESVKPAEDEIIKKLKLKFRNISIELEELGRSVQKGVRRSKELYENIRGGSKKRVGELVKELDRIDVRIKEKKDVLGFISVTIQKTINRILEEYDDHLSDEERDNKDLKVGRQSVILYEALKESINYNLKLVNKLLEKI